MKIRTAIALTAFAAMTAGTANSAFISEVHYDNTGGDTGETVEIVLGPGESIADVIVELMNGSGGGVYDTLDSTDFTAGATASGFTVYTATPSSIQNGSPDGLALSLSGSLVEFLSYEGSFEATGGVAIGVTSTDMGVSEPGSTPVGESLSLTDGGWQAPAANSFGAFNPGLTVPEPGSLALLGLGGLLIARRRR